MAIRIHMKIDVMKIDKSKLFAGKNGAMYLDVTTFLNGEPDKFGNYGMITQDVTKEERLAGKKGAILGNITKVADANGNGGGVVVGQQAAPAAQPIDAIKADLPF